MGSLTDGMEQQRCCRTLLRDDRCPLQQAASLSALASPAHEPHMVLRNVILRE